MAKTSDSGEVLRVSNLDAGYGHVKVIRGGGIAVAAGEVVALVGRNGAGKTTFLAALAGLIPDVSGQIVLHGQDLAALPSHKRVQAGLGICPSGGRLFKSLTVEENLTIGAPTATEADLAPVLKLFPELQALRTRYAGKLSGGERQMVAIGRALMLKPRLLLLDEPSEGLAPIVVLRLVEAIKALRASGVAMLVAEQNVKFTDLVCDTWYSIDKGVIAPHNHSAAHEPHAAIA
ncbi:ABC transporter ATP-binding protein [Ramlibacter sp.]|uniref:ABC transporter ATP-binding protein n=1 Tax=Ramlibacter sp. TaxID=1917967 RepID=UPI003D14E1A2